MKRTTKFSITDPSLFWSLQTINRLELYSFSTHEVLEIEDTYLDTKKHRLFTAGYSCCKRDQDQGVMITLTKLPSSQGRVKTWETLLDKNSPYPIDWPESEVRKRIIKVISNKKLRGIIHLLQTRIVRNIKYDDQKIGKFNLDEIRLISREDEMQFKQLQITLQPSDSSRHLEKITKLFLEKWPLEVDNLSKFERALQIIQQKNNSSPL